MFGLALVTCFLTLVRAKNASILSISIPLSAPQGAPTLSPTLFSLSIEQDGWTDWAGTDSPNTFLVNVLNNLKQRTGEPPWFRIGADSEDRTNFNPAVQFSQTVSSTPSVATPYPESETASTKLQNICLQERALCGGVNLRSKNMTAAVLEALSIKKAFDSPAMKAAGVTLEFIEIGNEPDLYGDKLGYNTSTWTVGKFVAQWTEFAANVSDAGVVKPGSGPKYFGPAFANLPHTADSFSPPCIITNERGAGEILTDIVLKDNIRGNLTQLLQDIAIVRSHGLDYVLGETNSCFGHGAVNTSNVGVSRAFFHQGVGYKYNAIQPATLTRSTIDGSPLNAPLPPHVQPAYYAALVAAEAIGPSGATTSVELAIDDDEVSGYAFYVHGFLKRVVLISHTMFFSGGGVPRGVKHIALDFAGGRAPPKGKVDVKRLFIPSADATSGLLWAGQSFDGLDGKASGKMAVQQASVDSVDLNPRHANTREDDSDDSKPDRQLPAQRGGIMQQSRPKWSARSMIAGAGGGLIASVATCPLDVVKTKLQAQRAVRGHYGYEGILGKLRFPWRSSDTQSIAKHDGLRGFYRGLGPTILGYLPTWAIYFSVYDGIKTAFGEAPLGASLKTQERLYPAAQVKGYQPVMREHPWSLHILSAMTAGATSTICTNPLWVIKTRFMVQSNTLISPRSASFLPVRYKHTLDAALTIYRSEGVSAFYRGLVPSLLGISHVAVQFPLYEQLKLWAHADSQTPLSNQSILLCSAVAKMTASVVTYPHEVVRTRLQTLRRPLVGESSDGMLNRMDRGGIVHTTRRLVRTEGWKSLYKGLSVNLIRTVPNSAVTMLTYELLMRHLYRTPP
ncbi:Mitochondrial nad transporter [Mycena venus]|uniref:Mitochondrial nad transporter n=1 Tax=Mycena venus TaxID=2733690 RepID=A0A8H6YW46_9AGAR|nr:Mitochondrial nad transporter [Mycena venus]